MKKEYLKKKVEEWVLTEGKLSEVRKHEPQSSYANEYRELSVVIAYAVFTNSAVSMGLLSTSIE